MKINVKNLFVLKNSIEVESLQKGAEIYGGATKYDNICISGFDILDDEMLEIVEKCQNIEIFVPSTINVNEEIDNKNYVKRYKGMLEEIAEGVSVENAQGSWKCEDGTICIEKQTILKTTINLNLNNYNKISNIVKLIKKEMSQEGVTLRIGATWIIF